MAASSVQAQIECGHRAVSRHARVKHARAPAERFEMELTAIGFAAFFLAALAVGIRLVVLGMRTRQLPELLIGIGVLGIGPIGFGFLAVGMQVREGIAAELLTAAGTIATAVGVWAKLFFNLLVYRRESPAGLLAASALALVVAGCVFAAPLLGTWAASARDPLFTTVRGLAQALALGWGALEAFMYWRRMRMRERIGLADPLLTNRFLMWAISAGAAGLGTAIGVAASLATGRASLEIPAVVVSSSAHGFVAAVGMWLAFAPPRAYRVWIAGTGPRG
jgi:hypothetical protein